MYSTIILLHYFLSLSPLFTCSSRKKRSTTNYEIIITLRTDMEPSDSLRKSIEDQINAASSSSGIRLSQQIDRFGKMSSCIVIIYAIECIYAWTIRITLM